MTPQIGAFFFVIWSGTILPYFWTFNPQSSRKMVSVFSLFDGLIGALQFFPRGLRWLRTSKAASTLHKKLHSCSTSYESQNSVASATLLLKSCSARWTFIFCFLHWMWAILHLPSHRPSFSWNLLCDSIYSYLIFLPSSVSKIWKEQKVFVKMF